MDCGLHDRVFIVTAASGGLGLAGARALVAEGARTVLVARRRDALEEAVAELGADRATALAAGGGGGGGSGAPGGGVKRVGGS